MAKLPGIGKKTALRLVLHLLKKEETHTLALADSLVNLRTNVQYCRQCHNLSDSELCGICTNSHRDASLICVVQDIRDVLAIENTAQYRGLYHILGGIISPVEGIGPADLNVESLVRRLQAVPDQTNAVLPSEGVRTYAEEDRVATHYAREDEKDPELPIQTSTEALSGSPTLVKEIIFALSSTMEGDTTAFYLTKRLKPFHVKVSTIARGVPIGGDLEYADEITLGRSIIGRIRYE